MMRTMMKTNLFLMAYSKIWMVIKKRNKKTKELIREIYWIYQNKKI